jgi:toxin ParE1/3/4
MRALRLSQQAQNHLDEIKSYTLLNWGLKQSTKYLIELHQTSLLLTKNPQIGQQRNDLNEGVFSFSHKSHTIYYKYNDEQLFILAYLHQSMLPAKHLPSRN